MAVPNTIRLKGVSCFTFATAILAWSLGMASAFAQDTRAPMAEDDPARVRVDDGGRYYFGAISSAGIDVSNEFTSTLDTSSIDRFEVNSLGGETTAGRVLGRWFLKHGLADRASAAA